MASSSSSSSNIVVAVRCRPLNSRELARGARGLVSIHGNQVQLSPPDANDGDPGNARSHGARAHSFAFDFSYNSMDKASDDYASQDTLFNDLGRNLLDHAFQGYNVRLLSSYCRCRCQGTELIARETRVNDVVRVDLHLRM